MKPTWRKSSSCWINTLRSQPSPSDAVAAVEHPALVLFALPRTWRSSSLRPRSSPRKTTTTLSKWLSMLFPALLRSCPKFKKSLSPRPAWNYLLPPAPLPFFFHLTCLVFEKFWSFFKFTSLSRNKLDVAFGYAVLLTRDNTCKIYKYTRELFGNCSSLLLKSIQGVYVRWNCLCSAFAVPFILVSWSHGMEYKILWGNLLFFIFFS
jgi:hypothetical protein